MVALRGHISLPDPWKENIYLYCHNNQVYIRKAIKGTEREELPNSLTYPTFHTIPAIVRRGPTPLVLNVLN